MKSFIVCSAIATALTAVGAAHARQVEVNTFSTEGGPSSLLEPGLKRKAPAASDGSSAVPSIGLAREFEAFAADPGSVRTRSLVQVLRVPSWMKGTSESAIDQPASMVSNGSASACGAIPYAPHPALNATQELRRQRYFDQMVAAACGVGVPVHLFDALIIQESRYNPLAISSKGASGLTQLMPGTAASLGVVDRWNVAQNLDGGARYLRKQLDTFGNWALALGAYNAGPGNVIKYGGLPPFRETRGYVRSILSGLSAYQLSHGMKIATAPRPSRTVTLASFSR
jgi:soluble lytic murein transglycosylase-like protein